MYLPLTHHHVEVEDLHLLGGRVAGNEAAAVLEGGRLVCRDQVVGVASQVAGRGRASDRVKQAGVAEAEQREEREQRDENSYDLDHVFGCYRRAKGVNEYP